MHKPELAKPYRYAAPKTLLRLNGPAGPAIQAVAASSPIVARQLVSWTPSYVHGLAIFIQANGPADRETAKRLFMADAQLQKARTVELLRWAGFGRPDRLVPLLEDAGRGDAQGCYALSTSLPLRQIAKANYEPDRSIINSQQRSKSRHHHPHRRPLI
jgi:hypothetical protein